MMIRTVIDSPPAATPRRTPLRKGAAVADHPIRLPSTFPAQDPMRSAHLFLASFILLAATHAGARSAAAQHAGHAPAADTASPPGERLGEIRFPTSASQAAQAEFQRGVLYLHNFHYPQARAAFRRARTLDPADAMSAAFEAYAFTQPVWNGQDTAAARAALRSLAPTRTARLAAARTPRERAWVDAIESLYDGDTPKAVRDTAFSRAMERLHAADPADPEAAAFYALSLLGLNQGDREPVAYRRAEEVSGGVLRAHPRHPGALHYLIHAVDDPANAARGLEAAGVYGQIATDAAHAQHMTSHIFIALGMWDAVRQANLRAHFAQPAELHAFGHGTHWLAYALVQQGRAKDARMWVDSMLDYRRRIADGQLRAARGRGDAEVHAILMTAAHVLDTEAWDSPLARMRFDTAHVRSPSVLALGDYFVGAAAARRSGRPVDVTPGSRDADALLADSMLGRIAARNARLRAAGEGGTTLGEAEVLERMLRAEVHAARGRPDSAVALLRGAGEQLEALPFAFGPPVTGKPPRERAAEMLLFAGRAADALAELDAAERMAPGRTRAQYTRARALLALGRREEAVRAYRALAEAWSGADVTFPRRREALWGSTMLPTVGSDASVAVDTVTYASGELALRGVLYRPAAAGRHPALLVLHGSNACTRWDDADMLGRLYAAHGYVAFFPCRRGLGLSAGQGEAVLDQLQREGYTERDTAYGRRSSELLTTTQLQDVLGAIAAVRVRADVDASRVAVSGLSYGGILSLLAAEADSTLRAAVAFAPAAMNWGWNQPLRDRLTEGARRTRVPVLVLQAENDWHTGPASELPAAVRAGGGDAQGKLYPAIGANAMDGHALMVHAPELWQDDVLEFLERHLRPGGAGPRQ
jgi:dienelactone hydrolase